MGGKFKISHRKRQCISAIIATTVTTIIAMNAIASAEAQTCTLKDVNAWHVALNDPQVEQSPDYILDVTQAFLSACPMRPERFKAHQVAGMAAADQGDVSTAIRHFRDAGWMTNRFANFYAISVYATAGDHRAAWRTRDQMVEAWRSRLERHPRVSIEALPARAGMIYEIIFSDTHAPDGAQQVWVAVPFGPGWPASLSLSKGGLRASLRAEVSDSDRTAAAFYDFNRCVGRSSLDVSATTMPDADMREGVIDLLTRYLAKPDRPAARSKRIDLCVWPTRLLPTASTANN